MDAQKTTILLVDDEVMVLTLGRLILERQGYWVCTATNGQEAIGICERGDPPIHCAIIDFTMSGLNGRETSLGVRREAPGLPIIIASGYGAEQIEMDLLGIGINAVIQKPFRRETLLATIARVLDRQ